MVARHHHITVIMWMIIDVFWLDREKNSLFIYIGMVDGISYYILWKGEKRDRNELFF